MPSSENRGQSKKVSPSQKSMNKLRKQGYHCQSVECIVSKTFIKRDLFNGIDIVAIHPKVLGVLGVQATSYSNHTARKKKLIANPILKDWVKAGNKLQVWSWEGKKKKGHINKTWKVHIENLTIKDFKC